MSIGLSLSLLNSRGGGGGAAGGTNNVSSGVYSGNTFSFATQDANPFGIHFNADESKLWLAGITGANIYQYVLSTPGDITTMSYDSKSFSVGGQESSPRYAFLNSDASKMWVVGPGSNTVYQYTLSTPGDVSTASYDSKSFSVAAQDVFQTCLYLNADSSKLWTVGSTNDKLFEYTLSTPGDVSTASYAAEFSVASEGTSPVAFHFSSDQSRLWVVDTTASNASLFQYTLSTPGDITTASYDDDTLVIETEDISPVGIRMNHATTRMWMSGFQNDKVYEYDLSA